MKCLNISSLLLINQKPYSKYGKRTTIYNNYKQIVNALLTSLAWNNFVMAKKVSVASVDPICSPFKITIKNRLGAYMDVDYKMSLKLRIKMYLY